LRLGCAAKHENEDEGEVEVEVEVENGGADWTLKLKTENFTLRGGRV
jgi:hypothetical protein